jgi:hypothetical protein
MSSKEVAEAFVESLKAIIVEDKIRMYPVSFDANLYDIEITHDAWGITLSLDGRGESFRVLLDDYYEIDGLSPPEAIEFIAALVAGRALVRVSKVPIFGRSVNLDVDLGSSRRLSTRRRWGSGLASWEQRMLEP